MAPLLYIVPYSQPVRATLMTIEALKVKVELKEVNLREKQQLLSDFTKLNPQHTVPTLVEDDGFVLWDSHAIMPYLVQKYGKEDSLYPQDIKKRAIVNQRLYFNNGVVFPLSILGPIIYEGVKTIPQDKIDSVKEVYTFLETFLQGQKWVAGNSITIADFALIATITSLDVVVPVKTKEYPNVFSWIKRAEKLPYYNANKKGLEQLKKIIEEKLKSSRNS